MKQSTKRNRNKSSRGSRKRHAALAKARQAKAEKPACQDIPPSTPSTSADPPDDIPLRTSASKRKLELYVDAGNSYDGSPSYSIIDINQISALISAIICASCGNPLSFSMTHSRGLVSKMNILCTTCNPNTPLSSHMTSKHTTDSTHDINLRTVSAFVNIGQGYASLASFSETLGIPVMSERTFSSHLKSISQKCTVLKPSILDSAVQKVFQHHKVPDSTILDVAVCFDGSWHKRGHTSKHGFASVIEMETGLVVDYHLMTSYCHLCQTIGAQMKSHGKVAFEEWYAGHKANCSVNHDGSAGMMEVEAARVMWRRSQNRNLRYTTMVSDGDSKTFTELQKQEHGYTVEKEECTNHVAKRLGTSLRNLCSSEAKRSNTLGGRKEGSLTQTKINLLQGYYKRAVASKCGTVEELRKKIMATLDHAASTDEKPQHHNCPSGTKSWCFYNRALALGMPSPSHHGKSSVQLSEHVVKYVRPVYERLTTDALLSRCLKGLTQNTNESIHAIIWNRCPKHIFVGVTRIEVAAALGVGQFNSGSFKHQEFLRVIGLQVSSNTIVQGQKRDRKRILAAERKELEEVKRRRKQRALASSQAHEELVRKEGGAVYSAGSF